MNILEQWLEYTEKAMRNIARGKNAFDIPIATIQARLIKVMQEEGILPVELLEKGLIRSKESISDLSQVSNKRKRNK